jgi:hypothetical protein
VIFTHYVDANLYHNVLTGRSVTGVLHFLNGTPIDWYSKKQATVDSAIYGSEFVAARTCVEQILDLHHTLQYLGVPVIEMSQMFGDNKTVVDNATKIHAKLHKRHTALLTKLWWYACVWSMLQPLLFWQGDTANIFGQ